MNWFQFGRLIHSLYSRGGALPDLDWIQSLGLLAVKLGQVHALRVDFLEREKCEHLARLYRRNAVLPAADFLELLKEGGGGGFVEQFRQIEPEALASASVGQVHGARLLRGEEVVIKAVKRGLRGQFEKDVASLRRLFRLAQLVYPKMRQAGDPAGILDDIEEFTLSELDLRHEVQGQRTLREIHKENRHRADLSLLRFAHIFEELCNENVMVSERVMGRTFDEMLENGEMTYDLLLGLFQVHGFYMFCDGRFHGDLHPGNVLLSEGRLCFIDTGYIGQVTPKIRTGLFQFFMALSVQDYPRCAAALETISDRPFNDQERAAFTARFVELYADFAGKTVSQVSLTRKMFETIRLGVHSGMVFHKGMFAIIRSLMYLDGMVLRCNPNAVLLKDMLPIMQDFKKLV